jgi:glucans biosynthesis protein
LDTEGIQLTLEPRHSASRGKLEHLVVQANELTGGWRVFFDLADAGAEPAELRLTLQSAGKPLSETWVYNYQAP